MPEPRLNHPRLDWTGLRQWTASIAAIELSQQQLEQLRAYVEVLLLWNRKLALVSQRDPGQILSKHVADSLFAAGYCPDGGAVVDLGSGAGFPGLVIAIARPNARVSLVESRGHKATFLEEARRASAARNVTVCNARIESLATHPEHRGRYAVATARALATTTAVVALARPFLTPGGRVIAMRAVGEPRSADPPEAEVAEYGLPDHTPRRLLIVRP